MTATGGSASPTDSILGVAPRTVYRPASVEDAVETVRACAVRNESLAFVGGGTDLELGAPPERLDAILRTTAIDRLVEHAPSDQIAVVEAGMTLAAFQSAVGAHRQRLALDPALPERRTIGGILAANAFGPRRARFGSVRDLLIGISFVRADGTPARGGGKVVKNVAGFDLPKLMVGSLGTLGLITTATFRLHPLPEEETTLLLPARSASDVRALASGIKDAQLEPSSVVAARREDGAYDVAVRFEGFRAGVEEQRDRLAASLRGGSASCEILDDPAAGRFWGAHDELRSVPPLRGKLAALPSHIEVLAAEVLPGLAAAMPGLRFAWYATLGLGFLGATPADPADAAAAIRSARERLAGLGGTLVVEAAPQAVRSLLDVWGPPPAALPLMRSVKDRLDPERRLAPGRFVGGI
ncbi:MAG TPA: FAD-binding oxidoreductase [Thermoanaerobaculia bacterium]|nr:FAD-binding oxidoreductase [Thermoanaerobaculia bacterium]